LEHYISTRTLDTDCAKEGDEQMPAEIKFTVLAEHGAIQN